MKKMHIHRRIKDPSMLTDVQLLSLGLEQNKLVNSNHSISR